MNITAQRKNNVGDDQKHTYHPGDAHLTDAIAEVLKLAGEHHGHVVLSIAYVDQDNNVQVVTYKEA